MIRPHCERCRRELDDYGAILLGAPDELDRVSKRHLCAECFDAVLAFIVGYLQ